jgi:hypothetical protein
MTVPEKREFFLFLAREVSHLLPAGETKFALLVFDEGGPPQYVGNANRADAVRAFREAADRIEADSRPAITSPIPAPATPGGKTSVPAAPALPWPTSNQPSGRFGWTLRGAV